MNQTNLSCGDDYDEEDHDDDDHYVEDKMGSWQDVHVDNHDWMLVLGLIALQQVLLLGIWNIIFARFEQC